MNSADSPPDAAPLPPDRQPDPIANSEAEIVQPRRISFWQALWTTEDWWANWVGAALLTACLLSVWLNKPVDVEQKIAQAAEQGQKLKFTSPFKDWLALPSKWGQLPPRAADGETISPLPWTQQIGNPLEAFSAKGKSNLPGIATLFVVSCLLFGSGARAMGIRFRHFVPAYAFLFALATLAYVLSEQAVVKYYNLEYALWALATGLLISNTLGTPTFARPALRTEFYIKTGLVLLGAEVLMSRLIELGVPGIFVAWVVTPIVLISTYVFGQKVLKMESRSLNMVISADMSVCGVSAAIATAAACKAKKEELSLAIGLSLSFTVVMMVVLPAIIKAVGMSPVLGGAWIGGTIDSTGAVAAAGGMLGDAALAVASTVKMIQNILIGFVAFGVAVYWVSFVESRQQAAESERLALTSRSPRPGISEVWRRFPKFVLGFLGASLLFSWVFNQGAEGPLLVNATINDCTKIFRSWFFCLAFVSIGLETNFRELVKYLRGGKPLVLYVCGQSLNLLLTLFMAWLMFEVVFQQATANLMGK